MRLLTILALILTITLQASAQSLDKRDNWTRNDLIEPADLAAILKRPQGKKPLIFNIGVADDIPGAKRIGAVSKKENLDNFISTLKGLPRTTNLVIYCGCCPFDKCPNVRPAVKAIKDMGFVNGKLLNLPTNLWRDWADHGYPVVKKKS